MIYIETEELEVALEASKNALYSLKQLERSCRTLEDNVNASELSVEERTIYNFVRSLENRVSSLINSIEYSQKEVRFEGRLSKQQNGRYAVCGYELSSGHSLMYYDEEDRTFKKSSLEHSNGDYYIVALGKDVKIEGILVQVK